MTHLTKNDQSQLIRQPKRLLQLLKAFIQSAWAKLYQVIEERHRRYDAEQDKNTQMETKLHNLKRQATGSIIKVMDNIQNTGTRIVEQYHDENESEANEFELNATPPNAPILSQYTTMNGGSAESTPPSLPPRVVFADQVTNTNPTTPSFN